MHKWNYSNIFALKALGVRKQDEILVPNITFPATLNAISLSGAKPILVDVDKDNLLMIEDLKKLITKLKLFFQCMFLAEVQILKNLRNYKEKN